MGGADNRASEPITNELIAGRYRATGVLGRGGVGEALAVFDERARRRLALKRNVPLGDERKRELLEAMLRREYAMLAQFAHPHVVEVFDFGSEHGRAFYTMEHLVGAHPGDTGPMPWRDVCAMLVDLCGPLALLHARGWVHRDISPRNVLLVEQGGPKLLDFGAMAALDQAHSAMGAPPCVAPETLRRERIDARTDLFGLGALGYFALTGRHAYPARELSELPLIWRSAPARPSKVFSGIPEALDRLIESLLCLDMHARPRQLAEVVARLCAVAGLPDERASTRLDACLTTPALIGRAAELEQLQRVLHMAAAGRGGSCIVHGPSGSGRTRVLDALAVEAAVLGHRVLRADATEVGARAYALARELGAAGEAGPALEAAVGWLEQDPSQADAAQQLQAAFHAAATRWGQHAQPTLIIVDDCDQADAESVKLLASLMRTATQARLSLVLSMQVERKDAHAALATLARESVSVELQPLSTTQVEQLLCALFGEVPNLARLSYELQQHGAGLPGRCMASARELVDSGRARFVSGSWQLPETLGDLQPSAAEQNTLDRKLAGLSTPARELLDVLALLTQPAPLPIASYRGALQLTEAGAALAEGELLAVHAIVAHDDSDEVRDHRLLARARDQRDSEARRASHARLGRFYANVHKALYAAYHFWEAGLSTEADAQLDAAINLDGTSIDRASSVFSYSRHVAELYAGLLEHRKERGAAPIDLYPLRMCLLAVASMTDARCGRYIPETLAQLRFDVGLDLLDNEPNPTRERVLQALTSAHARHLALDASQRGLDPQSAIATLAQCVGVLAGVFSFTYDAENLAWLPGLITPLRGLSPALSWVAMMAEQTAAAVIYDCDTHASSERILELTEQEVAGLSEPLRHNSRLLVTYYLGLQEAQEGQDIALDRALPLMAAPSYQALALTIRRLHALARGRFQEAQRLRRERERVPWDSVSAEHHLRLALLRESGTTFDCHDLLELTRIRSAMRELSSRFDGWKPWEDMCSAFCHLVADEPAAALTACQQGLQRISPFGHGAFQHLIYSKAWAHIGLGQYAQAEHVARETLDEVRRRGLQLDRPYLLETVLAVAEAGVGQREPARARLHALLTHVESRLGRGVLAYGRLCEAACQIAWITDDPPQFFDYLARMQGIYAEHPCLRARHAHWARIGHHRFVPRGEQRPSEPDWSQRIAQALSTQALEQQGHFLLSVVLDELDVDAGQLLRAGQPSLQLMASRPQLPDATLLTTAQARWANWQTNSESDTIIGDAQLQLRDTQGRSYCALWLNHDADMPQPVGVLLLACSSERLVRLSPALLRAISQHLR